MDRAKAYSWLLTIIMGVAITTALKEVSTLVATSPQVGTNTYPIAPALVRFGIFLVLSIRWTLDTLWYLDRAYLSKNPELLGTAYFFDLFVALVNFLVFVPLALTILPSPTPASPLSKWLNEKLLEGKDVSTFIWILALLLAYDLIWLLVKCVWSFVGGDKPRRVHVFWGILNLATLLVSTIVFLFHGFMQKDLQAAELYILYVVLIASAVDLFGTIIEDSKLSQWLSPTKLTLTPQSSVVESSTE